MSDLHKDCFAYSSRLKYPIHTKEATLKSFDLYVRDMDGIPEDVCNSINEKFIKAASLHDIKLPSLIKELQARPTHLYTDELGNTITFTKIATITDVLNLNSMIDAQRSALTFLTMRKLALYGFRMGELLGASLIVLDKLQKKAGLGIGDKLLMLSQFLKRASVVMMPKAQLETFYRIYNSMNTQDLLELFKKASLICLTLHNIDRLYNLTLKYGSLLKAPLDVCCSITVDSLLKEASDYLHVESTDTVLSKSALLDCKDKVNLFLEDHYNFKAASDLEMLNKVASLSKNSIEALLYTLE